MTPSPRRRRPLAAAVLSLTLAASLATTALAAQPGASIDDPIDVVGLPYTATLDATIGDPQPVHTSCTYMDQVLWLRYAPTTTGDVLVDTAGSSYDTVIGLTDVIERDLGCVDDTASSQQARLAFTARSGEIYLIGIGRATQPAPGEGEHLLPAASGEDLTLQVRIEQTRIRRQGAPRRSTIWTRGGTAEAHEVLVDEPDEYLAYGFIIDHGRGDARDQADIDLSWRHHRVDEAKNAFILEHWDAYGSPGHVAISRTLDRAEARGQVWYQGRSCTYDLGDGWEEQGAFALGAALTVTDDGGDDEEDEHCVNLGGSWADVDARVVGVGEVHTVRNAGMHRGYDTRELVVEHGSSRDGVASIRVRPGGRAPVARDARGGAAGGRDDVAV
jgi:hypothetical protein